MSIVIANNKDRYREIVILILKILALTYMYISYTLLNTIYLNWTF